ncbi:vancomycin resistance protein, partial [Leptospira levettii]
MGFKIRNRSSSLYPKKVHRSELRLFLGKIYFQWKRYLRWLCEKNTFATHQIHSEHLEDEFPISVFTHHSPIYR